MPDLAVRARHAQVLRGAEGAFVKIDRGGGVAHDQINSQRVIPLGNRCHVLVHRPTSVKPAAVMEWRTHSCAMPLSFPVAGHLHELWGRRPCLQPAPRPALREWEALDFSGGL